MSGTRGLALFLYAVGSGTGSQTVDAYASISAWSVTNTQPLAIVATNSFGGYHPPMLTIANSTYSSIWSVSSAAQHVLVDGMTNGWLSSNGVRVSPQLTTAYVYVVAFAVSSIAGMIFVVLASSLVISALGLRRRRHSRTSGEGIHE
jgi:hypothetical protein